MLALELEHAICRLEESTESLLSTEASDLAALCRALDRRANAITELALITATEPSGPTLERLAAVLVKGAEATRKIMQVRKQSSDEWARLNCVKRGLESSQPSPQRSIDCKG